MSSMVDPRAWMARQGPPRATCTMEVVPVSMHIIPMASSCTMQLAHIMATTRSIVASSDKGSGGTLKAVTSNGSLHKQVITFWKPRVVPLSVPFPEAHLVMWILALSPQPVDTLLPLDIEPSFPQNSGCEVSILTHGALEGPVEQQYLAWRDATLPSTQGTKLRTLASWFPPHSGSGKYWVPLEASKWGFLLLGQPFQWGGVKWKLAGHYQKWLSPAGVIGEGDIWLHHFPQLQDAPCKNAWLAQGRQHGLLHPILECLHIGHSLLQLSLSDILAGELWIWQQEEILLTETFGCWVSQVVILHVM